MSTVLHSNSAVNKNPVLRASQELAAQLAALTAERAAVLAGTVDQVVGWMPPTTDTEMPQRRATVRQAATRLVEIDAAIATTTAEAAAVDELLAAFDDAIS